MSNVHAYMMPKSIFMFMQHEHNMNMEVNTDIDLDVGADMDMSKQAKTNMDKDKFTPPPLPAPSWLISAVSRPHGGSVFECPVLLELNDRLLSLGYEFFRPVETCDQCILHLVQIFYVSHHRLHAWGQILLLQKHVAH